MSNLTGGLFKALAHFHLGAHLVGQFYGQMKCLRLALPQNRQEKIAMELLAVGASAVGLAALAAAFDERAGKHLAPRAQSANQPAAQGEIGVVGHLTLIIVSELGEVKLLREFARMTGKLSRPLLLLVQCIGPASEVALRNRYRKGRKAIRHPKSVLKPRAGSRRRRGQRACDEAWFPEEVCWRGRSAY